MSKKSFVFNDTETTGLNTWFSQIIQIGSVLTDEDFNVEEELKNAKASFASFDNKSAIELSLIHI